MLLGGLTEALGGVRPSAMAPSARSLPGRASAPERTGVHEALRRYSLTAGIATRQPLSPLDRPLPDVPDFGGGQERLFPAALGEGRRVSFSSLDYLGQIEGTYLVLSAPGVLILLDQHAAHERILYERLKPSAGETPEVQSLLLPEILEMNPGDFQRLMASGELMRQAGIEVEAFGENTAVVKSIPALLGRTDVRALMREILDGIADAGLPRDEKRHRILVGMACRGAIKAGQNLTVEEARRLCADLDSIAYSSNCPHGRPVFVELPAGVIERMFKRT